MGELSNNADDFGDSDQLDRIHELSWGLLDDHLNTDEMVELEALLLSDPTARETYASCAQLHAELASFFSSGGIPGTPARPPVLAFLGEAMPNISLPSAEELN